jgi:RNA polymerase sigma-70 factor (ECF subfamily)
LDLAKNHVFESGNNSWQSRWDGHAGWLRTVLTARLNSPGVVDEVLQQVAIIAWEKREQLDDANKMAPWLYRIAIRQVQLFWRTTFRDRKRAQPLSENLDTEDRTQRNPLDWLTDDEAHQQVRTAMKQMGTQDREILLLKHTENWTHVEIAERLGITVDKVIYRLGRARKRLRDRLLSVENDWIEK